MSLTVEQYKRVKKYYWQKCCKTDHQSTYGKPKFTAKKPELSTNDSAFYIWRTPTWYELCTRKNSTTTIT